MALRKLEEAGFGPGQVAVSTPRVRRHGHYGRKVIIGIAAGTLLGAARDRAPSPGERLI